MIQAAGGVLPWAAGVALSPIPIIAVILMLATPRARSNGPAFAFGWVAGLVVVSIVFLVLSSGADDPDSAAATGVNWFQVVVGVLLLVMAARKWRSRPKKGEQAHMPKWMSSVDEFTPAKSLGFGFALSGLNPKNFVLTAAAAASIAQAGLSGTDSAIAIAIFVSVGSLTVVGSVAFYLAATERAARSLASVKEFMTEHNVVIMMVILVILGANLLGKGLGALDA